MDLQPVPVMMVADPGGGWEKTRWRMSPSDVAAAVRGATIVPKAFNDASRGRVRVTAPHKMLGHLFAADFLFDPDDRLAAVRLRLHDPSRCEALYGELLSRYGSPIEASRPLRNDGWTDRRTGNRVTITDARADPRLRSCVVTFTPN